MKAVLIFYLLLVAPLSVYGEDQHGLFSAVLQKYVHEGRVNYPGICKDPRFEQYISQLKSTNPDRLRNNQDRFAFWINAYNAYTLKAVCERYPIKSINDLHSGGVVLGHVFKTTIWDKNFVIVNNQPTNLNAIEHERIRPVYMDPRAHFALVCASKSCPDLRPEAYEGEKLDSQLNDQARQFLNHPQKNRFDIKNKQAYISKIFAWYAKDFGKSGREILLYLSKFLPENIAESIQSAPDRWTIHHLDYDWSLNE